jgi:putative aldouronate transport system permease protein
MSESAFIDGANHFQVLFKIYLPVSKPAISTVLLFALVYHWNSWFDGIIYMNTPDMYPLQSYLQVLLTGVSVLLNSTTISLKNADIIKTISDRTVRSAEVFVGMIPIMIIYPFMQRFFIKGLVIGSVKG